VVDRAEVEPRVLDRHLDPVLLGAVDLVAQRARRSVDGRVDLDRLSIARCDHPAALIRRLRLGVSNDLVIQLAPDSHQCDTITRGYQ